MKTFNEQQRIQLVLSAADLQVLEIALRRYAVDHPDTEGATIALSIKDAAHNSFYKEYYHSLIREENERLGYIPCRLCSAKLPNLLGLVQHLRWGQTLRDYCSPTSPVRSLDEVMVLIYSWYKKEDK